MAYTTFNRKEFNTFEQPMFFGETVNVARYDVQKHKIFETLIEKQLSFFWRPEEVDLASDRKDFMDLPAHEQHIFLSNLKYQTLYQGDSMGDLGEYKSPAFLQLANEQDYSHLGALDFIDNQVNPQTGTIRVRATFSNAEHRFTPGLFARIKLAAQAPYNAVLVTDRAIGTDLNNKYVLVLSEDNHVEYRGIELGPKVNDMRIIRSGLEAGDIIVVNGLQRVRPGVQVQPETVAMFSPDDLATLRDEQQLVENSMQRLSAPLTADQRGAALKSPALATDPRG